MEPVNNWEHPTGQAPDEVIMLLLGESKRQYADALSVAHDPPFPQGPNIETWTCNAGFRIWPHDLLFVMDDLEGEAHKWPTYGDDLAQHNKPIITSTAYPRWTNAIAYPFDAVCDALKLEGLDIYFRNSVPYMLAYAQFIGVQRITIFGADYTHPNQPGREADRANAEWWMGRLSACGVQFTLASDTTLMEARTHNTPLYGYKHDPRLTRQRNAAMRTAGRIAEQAEEQQSAAANDARELSEGARHLIDEAAEKTSHYIGLGLGETPGRRAADLKALHAENHGG
jgi:hypothetical protein